MYVSFPVPKSLMRINYQEITGKYLVIPDKQSFYDLSYKRITLLPNTKYKILKFEYLHDPTDSARVKPKALTLTVQASQQEPVTFFAAREQAAEICRESFKRIFFDLLRAEIVNK